MSATEVLERATGKLTPRSESPIKPDSDAMEPKEEAKRIPTPPPSEDVKCVPSPSSSAYDADQSDSCSERRGPGETALPGGVVTEQMIEEEKKMKEEAEREERRLKEEREREWSRLEEEDKAQRFVRLQQLLQRSNMYTTYLIERMNRQQDEEAKRRERKAKKLARMEEKKKEEEAEKAALKEQTSTSTPEGSQMKEDEAREPGHNLRRKRTAAEADDVATKASPKAPAPKKRRAAKETKKEEEETKDNVDEVDGATLTTASPVSLIPKEEKMIVEQGERRTPDGEVIPENQPLMMTGGVLRPYQLEGFMWLRTLYENGVNGILADEMGLGKTVQCVAMLSHMVYMGVPGPFLVCAPLSTVPNWYNEFQRFAPKVPVLLYHGNKDERKELREQIGKAHDVRDGVKVNTIVITSYEVAMMDQKHMQGHEWRYLVVDEGHRIKNSKCRLISALRMYKTTNRLLLTGTPLQNNLAELWSLLNFLLPEIFDDLGSFEAWFDIEHIGDEMAADKQKKDVLSMLHQILTPFMLRRLKTDVDLNIPPKKEVIVYAPLRPLQKEFYAALIDRTIFKKIQEKNGTVEKKAVDSKGRPLRRVTQNKIDYSLMVGADKDEKECRTSRQKAQEEEEIEGWVKAMVDMQQKRDSKPAPEQKVSQLTIKLRNVMMQLRKCCSHPFLLEHPLDKKTGELCLDERIISESGKMLVLDRMLKELHRRGHKVLIFSQMTKMLDLLEDFCILRKYGYCRLDGAMNIHDRRDSMAEYQKPGSDKFVFLLSTRAGGLGITLTAADTVIIYDSDWNPQCDLQAQDRCHRIGQTRSVMVYRFVTANTIDQRIVERAAAKRKLEKLVIHQGKFKSGIKNFKTSLEPVSSEELLKLLNSRDHESEVGDGEGQEVINDADLEALLDRSDIEKKWRAKQAKAASGAAETTDEESIATNSLRSSPPPSPLPSPVGKSRSSKRQSGRGKTAADKKTASATKTKPTSVPTKNSLFKVIDIDDGESVASDL
ncbi:lymphocyte-specific helicase-like isoform X2 [Littorina saxatilis]|uniref:Proliferation-associated SNF2-like protein n=1 Tax=Littorina saxatilis TaxID=31220 RepID=A0AAN9G2J0_9CAEN